ncbi:hypothetical protein KBD61_06270 [Patescibacteria group bacterium]|nr:hypothetical protein [Patescibacteria group bacterium]MBP9710592.1 hypothetical protein [Patescibacteria group bacterium]
MKHLYSFLALVTILNTLPLTASAQTITSTPSPVCDSQAFTQSLQMSATAQWRAATLPNGLKTIIPYNKAWKKAGVSLTPLEIHRSVSLFGTGKASSVAPCQLEREYVMQWEKGTSYQPTTQNYSARMEKIGSHTVTIYKPLGESDCGGERAILFLKGYVVSVQHSCTTLDATAKRVIQNLR